jgi:putative pyruvate formate lyase activating enzyme
MFCNICPHNCNIDREQKLGVCRAPNKLLIAHAQLHHYEEPILSGYMREGSGGIFLAHCNLRCVFCQNFNISQTTTPPSRSLPLGDCDDKEKFQQLCFKLKDLGALNINLVSPTPYSLLLKEALEPIKSKLNLPIVWNSNGYEKIETLELLKDVVDVWLPDMKYFDDELAKKYSGAPNYFKFASQAILAMRKFQPEDVFDESGYLQKGLLIRHMILPGQVEDSLKILRWIYDNLGPHVQLSIMSQYYPMYRAEEFPEVNRQINEDEYKVVISWLDNHGFDNYFSQELSSADIVYTPKFDGGIIKSPLN